MRLCNNAHHKAGLIVIVEIEIQNAVFSSHNLCWPEPRAYKVGIFMQGPLKHVFDSGRSYTD